MVKNSVPNYLLRVCCTVCAVAIAPIGPGFRASAQTPSADLSFEVATVKPVDPSHRFDPGHFGPHVNPAGASYWSMTPDHLVAYTYGLEPFQITGPEWANHDRFDIEARFPEGTGKTDEHRMLQALLKDRFKLAFHIEKRELVGYALIVGKQGGNLKPSLPDPVSLETDASLKPGDGNAGEEPARPKVMKNPDGSSTVDTGKKGTTTIKFDPEVQAMHYKVSKMTMEELAARLRNCVGVGEPKVVDETGIKGTYQLEWDCPNPYLAPPIRRDADGMLPSDPQGESALTRSLDALGLKLEKRKTLREVHVIDHIERPSETN
jgi:uncharacterized protein (TIGR03435 family)